MFKLRTISSLLTLLICVVTIAGCSETKEGPKQYQVSGTVTFDGKPVPFGEIIFSPDFQKGNSGPQGIAKIVDGKFDTASKGRGIVGGPHQITITGVSEKADPKVDNPPDKSLFKPFKTTFDFPKEDTTKDFIVK